MSNFLLEIGTEELPADFARLVTSQLEQLVRNDLKEYRIGFEDVFCSSTPRRIFVIINSLADSSEDLIEERKGPPALKAFENGKPTQTANGFAKRYGLSVDALEVRNTPKGEFVFGRIFIKGESSENLIVGLIPKWINNIQGRRFMRWGEGDLRFSRPIRWILALLDDKEIKFTFSQADPPVISSRLSRGHRLYEKEVFVEATDSYVETLRGAGVMVSRQERFSLIKNLVSKASEDMNAKAALTNDLLNELTDLVEAPTLLIGEFQKSFLGLPAEVLSTVMQVHQRYIPLYLNDVSIDPLSLDANEILLPRFICICNGLSKPNKLIREGNEKVLRARFSDAEFFINADRSCESSIRRGKLSKVTFADGLGTLFDRVLRIEWLAETFLDHFSGNNSESDSKALKRAAYFCKHDLVSQMVGEFPELQGIMGAKYLLAEGESRDVSLAVLEQYLPRGQGSDLPKSFAGSALALVDRLELLLSIFAKGERPSGSSDPYALRRAANGVLNIIWDQEWNVNLFNLLFCSIKHWNKILGSLNINSDLLLNDLLDFFHQRITSLLEELGFDIDIVQSVAGETICKKRLLYDPTDVFIRASLINEMRKSNRLLAIHSVVNRASSLAEKNDLPSHILSALEVVDSNLFEKNSEHRMLDVVNSLEPIAKSNSSDRYSKLVDGLVDGAEALSNFFDGEDSVMVMTDNESIRKNRLNLLSVLRNQAHLIADFKLLVN